MENICTICDKKYKSYKSLWNHNKKFHLIDSSKIPQFPQIVPQISSIFKCKTCEKVLSRKDNLLRHEEKCLLKKVDNENPVSRKEVVDIFKEILSSMKIHPKTLEKINNQLINCNNTNSNNNTVINNNIIIPLSEQNLKEVLNKSDKMAILNSGSQAHLKLTDMIYNNPELKKYRNIYVTNLSNNIAYVYDNEKKCFIVKNKKDILEDYGVERFSDIQYFYEELKNKVNDKQLTKLKKMVNDYFNDNDFKDLKNKELLIELYNNRVQVQQIYETVNKNIKEIEL